MVYFFFNLVSLETVKLFEVNILVSAALPTHSTRICMLFNVQLHFSVSGQGRVSLNEHAFVNLDCAYADNGVVYSISHVLIPGQLAVILG